MNTDYEVCIIGSGAGGGPVAYTLAKAGHSVLVLEKGPWFRTEDFYKDELACCRRSVYTPELKWVGGRRACGGRTGCSR